MLPRHRRATHQRVRTRACRDGLTCCRPNCWFTHPAVHGSREEAEQESEFLADGDAFFFPFCGQLTTSEAIERRLLLALGTQSRARRESPLSLLDDDVVEHIARWLRARVLIVTDYKELEAAVGQWQNRDVPSVIEIRAHEIDVSSLSIQRPVRLVAGKGWTVKLTNNDCSHDCFHHATLYVMTQGVVSLERLTILPPHNNYDKPEGVAVAVYSGSVLARDCSLVGGVDDMVNPLR